MSQSGGYVAQSSRNDIVYSDPEDWDSVDIGWRDEGVETCQKTDMVDRSNVFLRRGVPNCKKPERPRYHRKLFIGVREREEDAPIVVEDSMMDQMPGSCLFQENSCDILQKKPCTRPLGPGTFMNRKNFHNESTVTGDKRSNRDSEEEEHGSVMADVSTCKVQNKGLSQRNSSAPESFCRALDNGMNVISLSHKGMTGSLTAKANVNRGWGSNFVKLNMKRNGSNMARVKGGKRRKTTFRRFRSRLPVQRQVGDGEDFMEGWEAQSRTRCFKCGRAGHWASNCESQEVDEERLELSGMLKGDSTTRETCSPTESGYASTYISGKKLNPIIQCTKSKEELLHVLRENFGHNDFRDTQFETISAVLDGKSCLNIMPTGGGKSLCYQLPALLMDSIVLVISPLVALMQDQCASAPLELNPAVLWSGQTPVEARKTLSDVRNGNVRLLFVSPERLANSHFLEAIAPWLPLKLVVVDEAHCISEWGQSFRPSYYRLGHIFKNYVSSECFLALTATATIEAEKCICQNLGISASNVYRRDAIPHNLRISAYKVPEPTSKDAKKDWKHVTSLFSKDGIMYDRRKVLVFCAFRKDAETLSKALQMAGIRAKAYHSGCSRHEKDVIVDSLKKNRLRVVVGTTAFGMGINIKDVDAVVHASMPRSIEEYVQQIGRSGRSGEVSKCVIFFSDRDFQRLRSLDCSSGASCSMVEDAVKEIFAKKEGKNKEREYVILDHKKLLKESMVTEEHLESMIGYLEARKMLSFIGRVPIKVKILFYSEAPEVLKEKEALVAAILSSCKPRKGIYTASMCALCFASGEKPSFILQELVRLSKEKKIGFEICDTGFCLKMNDLFSSTSRSKLVEELYSWLRSTHRAVIKRLEVCYRFCMASSQRSSGTQGEFMRSFIRKYFTASLSQMEKEINDPILTYNQESGPLDLPIEQGNQNTVEAAMTVIRRASEVGEDLASHDVACILHGIYRHGLKFQRVQNRMDVFWGSLMHVKFEDVLLAAEEAISCLQSRSWRAGNK